ncbi:MAG: hypothetical protein ACI9ZH_002399, partial [Paracoccaceae bacterium]
AQGLATHRNQIRPLRTHLHERNLHRRNRHILVMSPEPSFVKLAASHRWMRFVHTA